MASDGSFDDVFGDPYDDRGPGGRDDGRSSPVTLALLEDLNAVLVRHGFPPLRGYALAELTSSLYRIQPRF